MFLTCVTSNMCLQIAWKWKTCYKEDTEIVFPLYEFLMFHQSGRFWKRLCTIFTTVRFSSVWLIVCRWKSFGYLKVFTHKWTTQCFLISVNSLIHFQLARLRKRLWTKSTTKQFLHSMNVSSESKAMQKTLFNKYNGRVFLLCDFSSVAAFWISIGLITKWTSSHSMNSQMFLE